MLRNFIRNRSTTFLLLFSLTIGISVFIYISARVVYNKSFDTLFENYEQVYRVVSSTFRAGEESISQPRSQRHLGATLEANYPEVIGSGFLCKAMSGHYSIDEVPFTNEHSFHCSSGFLDIFSIQSVGGRDEDLLTRPNMVIISEGFAKKHFGEKNPLGKTLLQYPRHRFEIEAVFKDLPENSHFQADILISFHDNMFLPPPLKENWGEFSFYTYLELDKRSDPGKLEAEITKLCQEKNQKQMLESDSEYKFTLQPLSEIHTQSQLKNEIGQNVRGDYLNMLYLISIFILIISGFNYIYFSYSRIAASFLQYGLRKVFGAGIKSLFKQFLLESLLCHSLAFFLAMLSLELINIFPLRLDFYPGIRGLPSEFWLNLILILIISTLANPLILLMLIHKKSAMSLLNKQAECQHKAFSFKQVFTIIQFAIIVFLISTIAGISMQVSFLRKKDTGIDLTDKLIIKTPSNIRRSSLRINHIDAFEEDLTKIGGIRHVSVSNSTPGDTPAFSFSISEQEEGGGIKSALFIADSSYLKSYDINIIGGRGLNRSGSDVCVVSYTCMKQLGYDHPEDMIDRTIYLRDDSGMQNIKSKVSGVCEDFSFTNVKEIPGPFIILDWTENFLWGRYTLAFDHGMDKKALVGQAEKLFSETFPNYPFEYYWLEDYYNKQFEEELSMIRSLKAFALISILLGVLSLLSMVWHISQARTKEIGIRKVNGASALDIIGLLNQHFVKWVGIASLIALPLAWYFLSSWLNNFEYRIHVSIWIFLISSIAALLISSVTVTLQSIKVARKNPLDSIKYE